METKPLTNKKSIQERFDDYHTRHPEVYNLIVNFAKQVRNKGFERYGIDAIFQRIRWHYQIERDDVEAEFKLNNDFRSRYARLVMDQESDLKNFFEVRKLTN